MYVLCKWERSEERSQAKLLLRYNSLRNPWVIDRTRKGGVVIEMEPTNLWYGWYGAREAALRDPDDTYIFLAEPLSERPREA